MKRKQLIIVNIVLSVSILIVIILHFYHKKFIYNLSYDESPTELLTKVNNYFSNIKNDSSKNKEISIIFILNAYPTLANIEDIEKLHEKYNNDVSFSVLFNNRFRGKRKILFPYKFLANSRLYCKYNNQLYDKNFFIIFNHMKIKYIGNNVDIYDKNFVIKKIVDPNTVNLCNFLSIEKIKNDLIHRIKGGDFLLWNLDTEEYCNFAEFGFYERIIFINSDCSVCELNKIFSDVSVASCKKATVLIFSIYGNSYKIKQILSEKRFRIPVFMDKYDVLNVMNKLIDIKTKKVIIEKREI